MTLPIGARVVLNRHTRVIDGGRALLGGAPTRLVVLTPRARRMLVERRMEVVDRATAALADRLLDNGMADPELDSLRAPDDADVTYVVPVRDRPRELARLLASIGPGERVLVVDDASRDPDAMRAVTERAGAEFVPLAVNVGPGGARNAGLAHVTTPFVVFVDSDIVLDPDTVSSLLPHFADPAVGMAVPRIVGLDDGLPGWIGRYEDARSSLDLGDRPAAVRPRTPVAWASTACVVARVAALGDGFDRGMRVGEDVDLVWRAVDAGWRVRYEPQVRAQHEHRIGFVDWITRKAIYGSAAHPLAERHPHDIAPAVLSPWSVGFVLALAAQRRWSVPVALGIGAVTAWRISRKLQQVAHPAPWGAYLTANGAVSAFAQASHLLLRHWWPLTALGLPFSRRLRRATAIAAVVDVALEWRKNEARLDPIRFGVLRRLDDLGYGAGVWWSAIRARSVASLLPDVSGFRPERVTSRSPVSVSLRRAIQPARAGSRGGDRPGAPAPATGAP